MGEVSLTGITKSFGATPVLKGISLDIRKGEFLTLVGPSGCGKSTLLRIIAGLEAQDGGTVSIGGRPVDGVRPKARDVAMVFQSYALYPHKTVEQNMALPLRMRRLNAWQRLPALGRFLPGTAERRRRIAADVRDTAKVLDIEELLHRRPSQLSGGQRQRVAVGRAMVRRPLVFLMDEPLSNLDATLRVQMRTEIAELHRRLGVTFVYVTHDQAEAMTMSDRVAVMIDGRLCQVGPPESIYADPDDRRVAEFIGSPRINLLTGVVQAGGAVTIGSVPLAHAQGLSAGTMVALGVRPEAVAIAGNDRPGGIPGRIRLIEHLGSDLYVHHAVDRQTGSVVVRTHPRRAADLRVGDAVRLSVAADDILVFDADGRRLRGSGGVATPLRALA